VGELRLNDQAVAAHRMAIELSSPTSERLSLFYSNLGASLLMRFERKLNGNGEDLVEAISSIRKAIEISSPNDIRGLATRYACLASALATRARHGAEVDGLKNIEEALSFHRKIFELIQTTEDGGLGAFRDSQHIQEGDLLMDRYQISKDENDLTSALTSYEKALEALPQGHPYRSYLHIRYAKGLTERFQVSQCQRDHFKVTALEHYQLAAQSSTSSPLLRFDAARAWAAFASMVDSPVEAMTAYQTSVDLLALVVGLDQTLDRRHDMLARVSDLSRQASAFALSCGESKRAVEWLEASRCLVWGQLNNLRTPLDELRDSDEGLANRFAMVSATLEKSGTRQGPYGDVIACNSADLKAAISSQQEAVLHVELAMEYEAILNRIRTQPGLERFLKAPSFDLLVKSLPKSGYVVIINVHETRCDAICLSPDNIDPLHVRLPDFSYEKAKQLRVRLGTLINPSGVRVGGESVGFDGEERSLKPFSLNKATRDSSESDVPSILKDLWILVAKPIVDALGLSVSNSVLQF
jgi:tetratricopeptide (TPR) repeat protein